MKKVLTEQFSLFSEECYELSWFFYHEFQVLGKHCFYPISAAIQTIFSLNWDRSMIKGHSLPFYSLYQMIPQYSDIHIHNSFPFQSVLCIKNKEKNLPFRCMHYLKLILFTFYICMVKFVFYRKFLKFLIRRGKTNKKVLSISLVLLGSTTPVQTWGRSRRWDY